MKIFYRYLRNVSGQRIVTICTIGDMIPNRKIYCRGIAICSPLDNFSKKMGRQIARGRAMKAFAKQRSWDPVEDRGFYNSGETELASMFLDQTLLKKVAYNVKLDDAEQKFFEDPRS